MLNPMKLERLIEQKMAEWKIPGLEIAVIQGADVLYAKGFGVTSVEDGGIPVTPQTVFRIGSTSKPIAATVVMKLVELGKLELDRPILDYVPWARFGEEGAVKGVTLRHLLSHTAGLVSAAEYVGWRDACGLEAHVREDLPKYPMVAPKGKLWNYSNLGIDVAGYVAEVAGGKPYAQLVQDFVFGPLGMKRTTFDPAVGLTYPAAQAHELDSEGKLHVVHNYHDNVAHYPSGFVMSTVLDMARFAAMLMNGGKYGDVQILSEQSVAEMMRVQATLPVMPNGGYGLGLAVVPYKTIRTVFHPGGISSFGSAFTMVPEHKVAVSMLFNREPDRFPADPITYEVFEQLIDLPKEVPQPHPIEPDKSTWKLFTGAYLGNEAGLAVISDKGDHLEIAWNGEVVPMMAFGPELYVGFKPADGSPVPVGFISEHGSPVQYISIERQSLARTHFDPSYAPTEAELAPFVATFANSGDTSRITLSIQGGRLTATLDEGGGTRKPMPCIALGKGRFAFGGGLLGFTVEADGSVRKGHWQNKMFITRVNPTES